MNPARYRWTIGKLIVVWNWPVFDFTFCRWSHEGSAGTRIRFGPLKITWYDPR